MKWLKHLQTITHHRNLVMSKCFKCGLYKQGLLHDLSKYTPQEFYVCKYWTGTKSPISKDKELHGYSKAWLHHKGHNPHHLEYWLDNSKSGTIAYKMPPNYFAELICDRISASQNYLGEKYNDSEPLKFHLRTQNDVLAHKETNEDIIKALSFLEKNGEDALLNKIKNDLKEWKNKQKESRK